MSFDFNSEWNGTSASDIIFDIMKAKEAIAAQRFFTMNRKTKEKYGLAAGRAHPLLGQL